jgi:putative CocE/NonD family hydrolase
VAASVVVDQTAMATRDNVRLATEVWLSSAGGPRPAMLVRTPYGLPGARGATDPVGLAQAGWAVVLQDVRGRGGSDGEFEPYHQEILDGSDAISWCAAQPWCSGDVVTSGASYVGLTQWQAASTGPKALRAITPSITAPRVRDSFIYVGEAFQYATATQWALDIAATSPRLPAAKRRKAERLRTALSQLATTPPAGNGVADVFPAYGRWVDYDDTDYWRPIDVSRSYRKIDVPGYHVGGWHDIFSEGTIEGYLGMRTAARSEYARTNQRLVMGPWAHVGVYQANTSDWDFGPTATGLGRFPAELNEFLRASIDRRDVPTGAAVYVMGVNRWLDFADWPPPSEPTTLFLGGEASSNSGLLSRERPEVGRMDRYEHDPKDPVPTRGGRPTSCRAAT